jgi:hypothetical protein
MDPELHMIAAIAVKESMVSLNFDHTTTRDYLKDKKQCPDHTVAFFAQDALNQESSEHSYWNKSKLLKKQREQQPKSNDSPIRKYLNINILIKYFSNLSYFITFLNYLNYLTVIPTSKSHSFYLL